MTAPFSAVEPPHTAPLRGTTHITFQASPWPTPTELTEEEQ